MEKHHLGSLASLKGLEPTSAVIKRLRDEGYPIKEHWFPALPAEDREAVAKLLNQPVAGQLAEPSLVAKVLRRLEDYLRGHTEILLD